MTDTLIGAAVSVLETGNARDKAARARAVAANWRAGSLPRGRSQLVPDRPARPARPELKRPRDVPRRRITEAPGGRTALLHALCHIELNAIDLAFDIVARFGGIDAPDVFPTGFLDDWIMVGDDEARHFLMLDDRMAELDAGYGDLPAHDGLWMASMDTAFDPLARLAIVPMVLEARGLDVTPAMIDKLRSVGDDRSADTLQIIHDDEITHVAAGKRWFDHLCSKRNLDPLPTWQDLVTRHFKGGLKPPFNVVSRDKADFPECYYAPLAESLNA
ncbi:ferritin-like domain-containing protein [Rhodospirillaceae bacterium KN72]|uniref:Ferritin-like domain-containing protein n=1 Tax=Pacificispira spongiicola TaxID=2729598 RepID=A0A7Y0HFE3_9PROT|nr:ferritin-like domain-containing protein [Pacificispira spongiicola]NMM43134.1 ferritin-like domain-containing protein [Pacificispira spongiicola]